MIHAPDASLLVVEDSDEDFDTVMETASLVGLTNPIVRAVTGDECLAVLGADHRQRPAIVLLDLNIPGLDGKQALAAIRSDPALRALPVVVVSTSANPRDIDSCYALGANAYHVKPIRHSEHKKLVSNLFDYWLGNVYLPAPT